MRFGILQRIENSDYFEPAFVKAQQYNEKSLFYLEKSLFQ
jgi:hypothetical protein